MSKYFGDGVNRDQFLRMGGAGAVSLGVLGMVGCGDDDDSSPSADEGSPPSKPTGVLRVGSITAGNGVYADPGAADLGNAGYMRLSMIAEPLAFRRDGKIEFRLAESMEPVGTDASQWDVKLREGVEFSDGKPLRAEDLLFTIKTLSQPTSAGVAYWGGATARKTGPLSVRVTLAAPDATFVENQGILTWVMPEGYDPKKPIGTGPFIAQSIDPTRTSVFTANPNYWGEGPYVERIELTEFADDSARVNALLAKQVDVIDSLSSAQIETIKGKSGIKLTLSPGAAYPAIAMNVTKTPFDDVRVRQAMKLVLNRKEAIAQVYGETGRIGNDVPCPADPGYKLAELPQHDQDIEQVKSLLKAAGRENFSTEMNVSAIGYSADELSQVFVEHAKEAGVTVKLKKIDPVAYYTPEAGYGSYPFFISFGFGSNYLALIPNLYGPEAPYTETFFGDEAFMKLAADARGTIDNDKRSEMVAELMRRDHEEGGYIINNFIALPTAALPTVKGIKPVDGLSAIGDYAFEKLWVS